VEGFCEHGNESWGSTETPFPRIPLLLCVYRSVAQKRFFCWCLRIRLRRDVFTKPLLSNELFRLSGVMSQYFCVVYYYKGTLFPLLLCSRVSCLSGVSVLLPPLFICLIVPTLLLVSAPAELPRKNKEFNSTESN
jgi:hypothetical protein